VHGPYNSAMGLGHSNGSVTMWSPSMSTLLATTLRHHGPVTALAFEQAGFAHGHRSFGWKCEGVGCKETGPTTPKLLDISQKGLLGVAIGSKLEI